MNSRRLPGPWLPGATASSPPMNRRHDQEALRRDQGRIDRGSAPRLSRTAVYRPWSRRSHRRRDPVRRNPSAEDPVRSSVRRGPGAAGHRPRNQGGQGGEAAAGFPGDTITEGLDGLRERLAEYHQLGAGSPSGGPSSTSVLASRVASRSRPMPTRLRAMQRCARKRTSCQSSSPRY